MITRVHYSPASNVPVKATEDITGGLLVEIAGAFDGRNPTVKAAGAGSVAIGVIAHDVKADDYVTLYRSNYIVDIVTDAEVKAGDFVAAGEAGKAAVAEDASTAVGIAVDDAKNGRVSVALR